MTFALYKDLTFNKSSEIQMIKFTSYNKTKVGML